MSRRPLKAIQRRRSARRFLVGTLCLGVVLCALAAIFYWGYYGITVRDVVISGNHHLKQEEILALLGTRDNDPLFSTSNSEYYARLKKSPWIIDASIRKELAGRLILKIQESVPAAILILKDDPYLVDREGTVLERLRDGAVFLLPVIREIDPVTNRETYREALAFVSVLNDKRVLSYSGVIEVSGRRPQDISLKLDDVRILVGAGDVERKLERLVVVREEIRKKNMDVEYYDIRYGNRIIVKPVSPPAREKTASRDGKKKNR